jgi:ABC-type transport system involved in cytochrome c biogenesis permease subunit
MSRAIRTGEEFVPELQLGVAEKVYGLWPVLVPLAAAVALIFARLKFGEHAFLYEGALTILALVCYISAAVVFVTNLFVKVDVLSRLGLWTTMLGYTFGFSGWMIRWIEAGEKEGWVAGKVWRYFPLDNLYALTLGFCCGAALATLIVIRKPKYRMLGAFSLPLISVVLTLGICLGNKIITLMPILDSYWRPIHVSIATIAYGVCLMSFGVAFAYLLKDGIRTEALAIAVCLFGVLVFCTVGQTGAPLGILSHQAYGASLVFTADNESMKVRTILPGVGPLMVLTLFAILGALALFIADWRKSKDIEITFDGDSNRRVLGAAREPLAVSGSSEMSVAQQVDAVAVAGATSTAKVQPAKKTVKIAAKSAHASVASAAPDELNVWAWRLFWAATVLQAVVIVALFYQLTHVDNVLTNVPNYEMSSFGQSLKDQGAIDTKMDSTTGAQMYLNQFKNQVKVGYTSDPVSHGALVGVFVTLLMVGIIGWKREEVNQALPSLTQLDSLLYRTVGVALPLLSMLLITGAVWANESWGRYWGWDPKEVGALVSWAAYAGYLHTRISHGWRGRKSAYFAVLGFILVIFTWLGVSFLLPGLHSYAQV